MAVQSLADTRLEPRRFEVPRLQQIAPPLISMAYALFALAFVFDAFAPLLAGKLTSEANAGFENRQAGDSSFEIIAAAIYAASIPFLLVGYRSVVRTLKTAWPLLPLLAIAPVSVLWSVLPDVSLRRAIAMLLTMTFAYYVATSLPQRQVMRLQMTVFLAVILASLAMIAIGKGSEQAGRHFGDLRGIFANKNEFGMFIGLACVNFMSVAFQTRTWERWLCIGMMPISLALLWLSDARTPLIALILAGAFVYVVRFLYRPTGWQRRLAPEVRILFVVVIGVAGALVVAVGVPLVLSLLGRNLTLTGRVKLWEYAIDIGAKRPWLGAGFKTFWTDAVTYNLRMLHQGWKGNQVGENPLTGNAHDAYLDVWLELGWLGVCCYALFLGSFMKKIARHVKAGVDPLIGWNAATFAFMTVFWLTNGGIMEHSQLGWFIMVYAYFSVARREADPDNAPWRVRAQPAAQRPLAVA